MLDRKTKTVTLTLTQSCNLSCTYCYEQHKSNKKIDISTAKNIIDFELSHSSGFDNLELDLFGGEPFLEFDLVKEISEYVFEKKADIPCTVFASTNGTLVHGEIQSWLKEHKGVFICGLSLDGTREMHNLNRSNSYGMIDLNFFLKMYPEQAVKMTISRETLPFLAEGIIELHKKGFLISCNLAYEIDWSSPLNGSVLQRELEKIIAFYLENPHIEPCSMLDTRISPIGFEIEDALRYCGAGIQMRSYDVDGQAYPCQFFMPLSIGEKQAALAKDLQFPRDILPKEFLDDKCKDCVIRSICPNCFGANYVSTGNLYSRDDNMCHLTKIMIRACSYFRAKQWELGQLNCDSDELQLMLRAIKKIQEELEV